MSDRPDDPPRDEILDAGAVSAFLDMLTSAGPYHYYWTLVRAEKEGDETKRTHWWTGNGRSTVPVADKTDVYFGVHGCFEIPRTNKNGKPTQPQYVRARLEFVAGATCLFAEFDAKDFTDSLELARAHVRSLDPQPSAIVASGGGFQCYWLFDTPLDVTDPPARQQLARVQEAWVQRVGGDPTVHDLPRILRVPGTTNYKYTPPRPVELIEFHPDRRFAYEKLVALVPPPVPAAPAAKVHAAAIPSASRQAVAWAQKKIDDALERVRTAPDGHKHNKLRDEARLLGGLIPHGLADEFALAAALLETIRPRAANIKSAEETIADGLTYGKAAPLPMPDFPTELAILLIDGRGCCPSCDTPVERSQWAYFGTQVPGWYCRQCKHPMVWPIDAYTPPTPPTLVPARMKALAALTDSTERDETPIEGLVPGSAPALAVEALQRRGYLLRRNTMTDTITVNGRPMDDALEASIHTELYSDGFKSAAMLSNVITRLASEDAYHPVRDWLGELVWNERNYISHLTACLHSSDMPVSYPNGETRCLAAVYLTKFLVGAVDRVYTGAQNMMLVLSGEQGIGKSQLARWLGSGVPEAFYEGPITPGDKDCLILQSSKWLWEVSELDATTRRADVSALKDFITRETVTARLPYGRRPIVKPALASCIGTVNDATGFLSDPTGNRRFMVLTLTGIDFSYGDIPIDQLWAQAVALHRKGWNGRLSADEQRAQAAANLAHEIDDPIQGWLLKHFKIGGASCMTSSEIIDHLTARGVRLHGSERTQAINIGVALKRLGVARSPRVHGMPRTYEGIAPGIAQDNW